MSQKPISHAIGLKATGFRTSVTIATENEENSITMTLDEKESTVSLALNMTGSLLVRKGAVLDAIEVASLFVSIMTTVQENLEVYSATIATKQSGL